MPGSDDRARAPRPRPRRDRNAAPGPRPASLRNLRLTVAYDGGAYRGFEVQPGRATVRGVLEQANWKATGERVRLHAGARTDAGVHATGQVVSFFSRASLPPPVLRLRIADALPDDVAVSALTVADKAFHARHSAIARRYRYLIATEKLPLLRHQCHWIRGRLDVARMERAARPLEGRHDFTAFGDLEKGDDPFVTIQEWELASEPPMVRFEIMADRFLWKMVRRIVGALVGVGLHELPEEVIERALADPRGEAAQALRPRTAPPHGLVLLRVIYPGDLKPFAATLAPRSE